MCIYTHVHMFYTIGLASSKAIAVKVLEVYTSKLEPIDTMYMFMYNYLGYGFPKQISHISQNIHVHVSMGSSQSNEK